MFRTITTGSKALLTPTSLLGLLALLLGMAFWGMRLQDDSLDHALHGIVKKTNAVAHIRGGATAAHARTYRILTHIDTRFPKPAVAREIRDVHDEMRQTLQALDEMARLPGLTPDELNFVKTSFALAREYQELMQGTVDIALIERAGAVAQHELAARRRDGSAIWVSIAARVVRDDAGQTRYYEGTLHDITQRKRAEAERQEMQRRLLAVSRQAGMAEIATNVLHNVGNILNSVNVSAGLIGSRVRASKAEGLSRAVQLLDEHAADLGDFLSHDEKGKLLPAYLGKLARTLAAEQQDVIGEIGHLTRNIDHIKDVVATQQAYAGSSSIVEPARLSDLLEDALRISDGALTSDRVRIVKDFSGLPVVQLDRTRVVQILVNLIDNARQAMEAMDEAGDRPRRVTLRTGVLGNRLQVSIIDTGKGIAAQDLTRIFTHGFTTRQGGHGFGLHSCALAAKQMGGTLTVHSDGPGQGARFRLELPLLPAAAI